MRDIESLPLRYLTIKPTAICGYSCPYCSGRQELFSQIGRSEQLLLSEWREILQQARTLGVTTVRISGGEPTLFKELPHLVGLARESADHVLMYSNGKMLDFSLAKQLKEKGLDGVSISLLSLQPQLHDQMRQTPNSHAWAIDACRALVAADLYLSIHIIVSRLNYQEIPEFIRYAKDVGVNSLELHYPENDLEHRYLLMDTEDIHCWRDEVMDSCIEMLGKTQTASDDNIKALKSLYSKSGKDADHSNGIYWSSKEAASICTKPSSFAMIYPNGDVLPCNGVEYAHEPIIGNVQKETFCEIWEGSNFQKFRSERTNWCRFCPMPLHSRIMLK